jgi:diguanylate cyclase (GGDEF)-like protein
MDPIRNQLSDGAAGTSRARNAAADASDRAADTRDIASDARDAKSDVRDEEADARGRDTADASVDRSLSKLDRGSSAEDRHHASDDRQSSKNDRRESSRERTALVFDSLTGTYVRATGWVELEREVTQAQRTKSPFTLAFIDINNLKAVNDSLGHLAGDALIERVATTVRSIVREYDVVMRYGGDEFVCGLSGATASEVKARFDLAASSAPKTTPFSVGIAQLEPSDDLRTLLTRADRAMYTDRLSAKKMESALNNRVLIEQVKGMLAEQVGISPAAAFELLQTYARTHHHRLLTVAQRFHAGTLSLADVTVDG